MSTQETQPQMPTTQANRSKTASADPGRAATWFVVKLVVLTLIVGFAESYLHGAGWGAWLQEFVARLGVAIVAWFVPEVTRVGHEIKGCGPVLVITLQCTALFATGLFCAAVIAFPCSWRARLIGLVVGVVGVGIVNILRIVGLTLISKWVPELLDFAHLVLMQGFLISCVAPLWLAWAVLISRHARKTRG